jgi:hypothetical protein
MRGNFSAEAVFDRRKAQPIKIARTNSRCDWVIILETQPRGTDLKFSSVAANRSQLAISQETKELLASKVSVSIGLYVFN